jgi:hypothetical protein
MNLFYFAVLLLLWSTMYSLQLTVIKYTKKQTTNQQIDIKEFFCIGLIKNIYSRYVYGVF